VGIEHKNILAGEWNCEEDSGPGFILQQEKSPVSEGGLYKISLTTITHPNLFCAREVCVARAVEKPEFRSLVH
jgi:hypothetical protein